MTVTIFGKGNMAKAIAKNFELAGNKVEFIGQEADATIHGNIVVFAVPYTAIDDIIGKYQTQLAGKVVIDITNPVDFSTMDDLVIPADTSAAEIIQKKLSQSEVVKGFNTTFAATLVSGEITKGVPTTVQLASDSTQAKEKVQAALKGSPLAFIDAGALKRARQLEALGFLNISLAVREQISWTGGFAIYH
ncbi:NADPH-dependent F420 reductase [Gallibacterium salpingitidis]|uniref:Diguanylate cyclase n=1 Tax=Gallibacterium salpingitidis TaxID=505341 RepID=A0A1A7NSW7_9PAST|nr:NADPH-dependent F420 reductase [Gallibacterium salpingitidis]OBW92723.1 diguanylate cyclase [Gallibacterium salpingitidis]